MENTLNDLNEGDHFRFPYETQERFLSQKGKTEGYCPIVGDYGSSISGEEVYLLSARVIPISATTKHIPGSVGELKEIVAALTEQNEKLKAELANEKVVSSKTALVCHDLTEDNKRLREALESLANMSLDTMGRAGCTYGDTDFDSLSAVHGYNCAVESVNEIASKALHSDHPKS